jgi:hypothetical protein
MSWFFTALKFLPIILAAIKSIEELLGDEASGKVKKQLVLNAAQAAAKVAGPVDAKTVKVIAALVDLSVDTLNSSGLKKGASLAA